MYLIFQFKVSFNYFIYDLISTTVKVGCCAVYSLLRHNEDTVIYYKSSLIIESKLFIVTF